MRSEVVKGYAILAVILSVIGGLVYGVWLLAFAKNDPVPARDPIKEVSDLGIMCDRTDPEFYADAAPYRGDAPHPIRVFEDGFHPTSLLWGDGETITPKFLIPEKPEQVQLIACLSEPDEAEQVGTCSFDEPEVEVFDLYRGVYDVTVYEAKTGKTVAELEGITGEDNNGCPPITSYREGDEPEFHTPIDKDTLRQKLKPYVEE
ncbi:hypothetical protein [Streptomyces sp. WMMB 322]|uniref:hypothetical protein n=1 Tax=Streptomyces sp. WMMB 322 TaxID=1286821 RepID=UPI000823B424|nr:hypothetical protein [Streptomyces sp. WMMB 322]SCK09556.1 hypothetical protein H180DRAFT_00476 [Streptomyces sp. WMMB 322]